MEVSITFVLSKFQRYSLNLMKGFYLQISWIRIWIFWFCFRLYNWFLNFEGEKFVYTRCGIWEIFKKPGRSLNAAKCLATNDTCIQQWRIPLLFTNNTTKSSKMADRKWHYSLDLSFQLMYLYLTALKLRSILNWISKLEPELTSVML